MKTRLTVVAAALMLAAAHGAQASTAAGTVITNQATATYLDGLTSKNATSNTVTTTVQQVASLTVAANAAKSAAAGAQVVYPQSVTNTGNGNDTFNLAATNSGQFSMTGVQFFLDADGNGVADNSTPLTSTGVLAAGTTFRYVAVATLPTGAAVGNTNTMVVTATSTFTNTVNASATDTTTVAAGAAVDLTVNTAGTGSPGYGAGVEASPVVTGTTTPGNKTSYKLLISNSGGSADTFVLSSSNDPAFGTPLPTGWTVVYKDASGAVITSTTVNPNATNTITAEVTPPAGATPGTTDLYFRAQSPTTNVTDRVHTAITVNAANVQVTLTKTQALDATCDGTPDTAFSANPIATGAVPGACIRYQITATNSGNGTVGAVTITDVVPANTTYHAVAPASSSLGLLGIPLAPAGGQVGSVIVNVGVLNVGEAQSMTFGVRINP